MSAFAVRLQIVKESNGLLSHHVACLLIWWKTYCADGTVIMHLFYSLGRVVPSFCIPYSWLCTMLIQTYSMCVFFFCAHRKSSKMPEMSTNYKIRAFSLLCATMLFSTFPPSPSLCGQPDSSKRQKYTGRKITLRSWFNVRFPQWYRMVGLKAKAREHSSNSLPAGI